jgi:hypothetical protein
VPVDGGAVGADLRHRHDRLSPAEAGLSASGTRRAPGLRRCDAEALALLGAIGLQTF